MSEKIAVGDLVVVVRQDCCTKYLGRVFRVMTMDKTPLKCYGCGTMHAISVIAGSNLTNGNLCWAPASWLRKIPPLSELEGQHTQETLRVPCAKERV